MDKYFHIELQNSIKLLLPLVDIVSIVSIENKSVCQIPGVPSVFFGTINYQNTLLWLLDLSLLLNLGQFRECFDLESNLIIVVLSDRTYDLTARPSGQRVGCIVSTLVGIEILNLEKLEPLPAEFSPKYLLTQVVIVGEMLISILNNNAILSANHYPCLS